MSQVDWLERLDALLARGIGHSDDYDTAKLQLAIFYYLTKASRAARASIRMAQTGSFTEALLLLRGLYDLVVDCLWMCLDPVVRARLFYDATAVGFERQRELLKELGVTDVEADTVEAIEHNRRHFEQAGHQFKTKRGNDRPHWSPGTIRDRAAEIERVDPDMEGIENLYLMLYKVLSAYEHSEPALCFQFVAISEGTFRAAAEPSMLSPQAFGSALGLLLGALVKRASGHLGLTLEDFK